MRLDYMAEENNAPEKLIINGQEYSLDDVAGLVDKGNKYDQIEKETNTPLDKVFPEFTKSRQQIKDYETQIADRDRELAEYKKAKVELAQAETPEEITKAKAALRQLGTVDEDYLKQSGYMTKQEAEEFWNQKRTQEKEVETINREGAKLEEQIDGTDGRTPFVYLAVLAYANAYRKETLMEAYNEMNERANKKWMDARLADEEAKKPTPTIRIAGGAKEPKETKVTNDNLTANLSEIAKGLLE